MVNLIIGIHNHQPVGNFDEVLEQAYRQAYLPFIETLRRHPKIKISIHFSGILYDWFEREHKDYLALLKSMAQAGQLEMLGGGYYEPILAVIPQQDRLEQLRRMSAYVEKRFGAKPQGVWLAERVWEPALAETLAAAGVDYTVLDDVHFFSSGLKEAELDGYYTTESSGRQVYVFPISQRLRYLMPFSDPERTIDFLRGHAGKDNPALVMADDGEKFGLWPETHKLIYTKGWLDRMFTLIEQNSGWLKTSTFSEYLKSKPSKGLVYLPTTSYYELSQWALPAEPANRLAAFWKSIREEDRIFLRGSYFRNFFARYPESNRMYRKMLRVSHKAHKSKSAGRDAALDHLLMSQCNCGYWHGVFGGLYLPHIRAANYANMIKAETLLDESGAAGAEVLREDWDGDGKEEMLIETGGANWYFSPAKGGGLWEWDIKGRGCNMMNVLSRRKEAYHERMAAADAGGPGESLTPGAARAAKALRSKIACDWHTRASLLDHFLHPDTKLSDFARANYGEQGDFVTGAYKAVVRREGGLFALEMAREGAVWVGDTSVKTKITKEFMVCGKESWKVRYTVLNSGPEARLWHGAELVFGFSGERVCPGFDERNVSEKIFDDPVYGKIRLSFDKPVGLWSFPLKTVSQCEEGFEETYQGSVLLCHNKLHLAAGGSFEFEIAVEAV